MFESAGNSDDGDAPDRLLDALGRVDRGLAALNAVELDGLDPRELLRVVARIGRLRCELRRALLRLEAEQQERSGAVVADSAELPGGGRGPALSAG